MQEDTDGGEEEVRIFRSVSADSNICWEGEEYQAGDLLLPGRQRLMQQPLQWRLEPATEC